MPARCTSAWRPCAGAATWRIAITVPVTEAVQIVKPLADAQGLYDVQWKQTNPSWYVPNSAWAGKLAGKVFRIGHLGDLNELMLLGAIAAVLLLLSSAALAQFEKGVIAGTVTDASGAVVVGAAVTVTGTGTNAVRTATTDGSGT